MNISDNIELLISQLNPDYELKRALLMTNSDFKKEHRNLEMKDFDSLNP